MNTQYENTEGTTSAFDAELEALVSALETKWAAERTAHENAEAQ
ncbi:hypothetical protein [Asticcacaulis sp. AND118]|nr:hypothetical protein [Asticcacaulis sp. AND118]